MLKNDRIIVAKINCLENVYKFGLNLPIKKCPNGINKLSRNKEYKNTSNI